MEEETKSRREEKKITEDILENEDFIALVVAIVKKKAKKAIKAKTKKRNHAKNFGVVTYSIGAPSAAKSDRLPSDISD